MAFAPCDTRFGQHDAQRSPVFAPQRPRHRDRLRRCTALPDGELHQAEASSPGLTRDRRHRQRHAIGQTANRIPDALVRQQPSDEEHRRAAPKGHSSHGMRKALRVRNTAAVLSRTRQRGRDRECSSFVLRSGADDHGTGVGGHVRRDVPAPPAEIGDEHTLAGHPAHAATPLLTST